MRIALKKIHRLKINTSESLW